MRNISNVIGLKSAVPRREKWWARSDSNTRPADYESDALTN